MNQASQTQQNVLNRLQKQRETVQSFDLSLQKCENAVAELDSESLQKFSAAGSNGDELRKQLDDITVST